MLARQLEALLAKFSGRTPSDLDIRGRGLREEKYVPQGGRGPHAPHIDARAAAATLIAAAGSTNAVDAAKHAVPIFRPLIALTDKISDLTDAKTFGDALVKILADIEISNRVSEIRLYHHIGSNFTDLNRWAIAIIEWKSKNDQPMREVFVTSHQVKKLSNTSIDSITQSGLRDVSIIGGGLLTEIAAQLVDKGGDE